MGVEDPPNRGISKAYIFSSGCARPSPAGKDSATRRSPACPNPRPGSRIFIVMETPQSLRASSTHSAEDVKHSEKEPNKRKILRDVEMDIEYLYEVVPQLSKVFRITDKIGEE
ncbi:hypothetical protein QTP70_000190 [Hemibagrus guttatus]|uniref:Uncharacterized protein n=1 Tax=Hemibagrus guttatus TaxID=175788 RepID=A0AAE0UQ69_9TELE|nr:hypothetical protein QTP70_000190 [Hemibagrus guttatus]